MDAYWSGGLDFDSPVYGIDEIFSKRQVCLEEVLSHGDVISECKYLNSKLLRYLATREVVDALVRHVITTKAEVKSGEKPSILPYVASELFACEVKEILDVFFLYPELLDLLFSFLNAPPPLSPGDCAYFCKVVVVLITKRHVELMEYIKTHNVIDKILTHIGVYSIMELLIRIGWDDGTGQYYEDEDEGAWLQQAKLVSKLVGKLDPSFSVLPEVHTNVACAIVDAVVKSSPMVPKTQMLVSELQSKPLLDILFQYMFSGNPSSLTHTLSVAIVLVQSSGEYRNHENKESPPIIQHVLAALPRLLTFVQENKEDMKTQHGAIRPCGPSRLKIVELVLALVRCVAEEDVTDTIPKTIIQTNALGVICQLFLLSPWNNLLHGLGEGMIHTILDAHEEPCETNLTSLRKHLFSSLNLLSQLIDTCKRNTEAMSLPKGSRLGFMGHILRLSATIQDTYPRDAMMMLGVKEEEIKKWELFLAGHFREEFQRQQVVLGGKRPMKGSQQTEEEEQDLDGLKLDSMLAPVEQYTYDTSQFHEEDEEEDDEFFNWEEREVNNDSDDSDDGLLQAAINLPPPPPEPCP